MADASPLRSPRAHANHRRWIPITIGLLTGVALVAAELWPELDRNFTLWLQSAALLLGILGFVGWFLLLSRFPGRIRWVTAAVLLALGVGLRYALRVDGTIDGRGLPRLAWKWSERRQAPPAADLPIARPAASMPAPAGWADVPQFFGPNRDGVVRGAGLARDWAKTPPREVWRQPIGAGWAAFAVVAGRAFTQEQRGAEEWVSCYEAMTGRLLWSHRRPVRFFQWQAGEGPHATPAVADGKVFAYGATGILDCLDAATGARVWTRAVLAENQLDNLEWGISASPLVVGDLVIVTGGKNAGPTVLAYDRVSGELRWRSGTDRASYASPVVATLAGRPVVLSFNAGSFSLHDPATGALRLGERWANDKTPRAAQPLALAGDRVFVTAGYGLGCELFQIRAAPDGTLTADSVWKNIRLKAQFNSVAAHDGHFYGLDDGLLACVEIASGTRRWKDGRYGAGQTLIVDDLILVQAERGDVALVAASPDGFQELSRIAALSSKTWNHPTLAGRHLLVRNDREAVCYELPVTAPSAKPKE